MPTLHKCIHHSLLKRWNCDHHDSSLSVYKYYKFVLACMQVIIHVSVQVTIIDMHLCVHILYSLVKGNTKLLASIFITVVKAEGYLHSG